MTDRQLKYFDILAAKEGYAGGKNVTELLRAQKQLDTNTTELIETAYDLQAGSYIAYVTHNPTQARRYANELASLLDRHIAPTDSLLDIGTGELTTLSLLTSALRNKPKSIYAFDISWSRVFRGINFAKANMAQAYKSLTPFVSDISEIPLADKSINITTSSHALEPNGGILKELMAELFRITIDKLVLFEPCFEIATEDGKQRMERLGYIKDVDGVVSSLGGKVVDKIVIENVANPLNPTVCFVITPPRDSDKDELARDEIAEVFSVPGTNYPLKQIDNFYFSKDTGLCYPILKGLPILKSNSSVLASALADE